MPDIIEDPLTPKNGLTLTPFHLITLIISSLSLFLSSLNLPLEFLTIIGIIKRISFLFICLIIGHLIIISQIENYQKKLKNSYIEEKGRYDPIIKSKIDKKKNDWENPSSHPSHFLTTRDGKPRLFPFPLGLAGGNNKNSNNKKTLWWEAGNSAHVGHYNQRETPEAREQFRLEVENKEKKRQKKAKKAIEEYEKSRKKWQKRLIHLKLISIIVIIGIFHRKIAVICLAGLIYYIFAIEITSMLKPKYKEEETSAKKRKKIPTTPGMAMTYIYEKDGSSVKPSGAIPTKSPSHRLMTSLDSRYAS
ncbi:uncharacterized protein I206_101432 [Kwoniella pini CBS 10737]|uniref:Uncharacterized protein n=1 Tax=Kwoniella pini CBS 10737 TaxID=1296096 RepID=A0A1B9HWP8_9TREE|nr:uncharacterized protein I206_06597 [Kwoniella pini CBS 10737]OCF47691.1 hypothetical protein I206_06597 [Kwoniella pini CBS 10737]